MRLPRESSLSLTSIQLDMVPGLSPWTLKLSYKLYNAICLNTSPFRLYQSAFRPRNNLQNVQLGGIEYRTR